MSEVTHEEERWVDIPGWEGSYQVSDLGRVRGVARSIVRSNGSPQSFAPRILRPIKGPYGHLKVRLHRPGYSEPQYVHRLVLLAFVGPAPDGNECCHNDGDAGNNVIANLRWDTPSSNNLDMNLHGTRPQMRKEQCPYGHLLAVPNLVAHKLQRGHRACRACQAAYNQKRRRRGRPFDFQAASDARYRQIMAEALQ